jgi:hypothetical protein
MKGYPSVMKKWRVHGGLPMHDEVRLVGLAAGFSWALRARSGVRRLHPMVQLQEEGCGRDLGVQATPDTQLRGDYVPRQHPAPVHPQETRCT